MNRDFEISYRSKKVFDLSIKLAFESEYDNEEIKVVGYTIANNIMYLHSFMADKYKPENYIAFPYKMNIGEIVSFVYGWLSNTKPNYPEPDTDGHCEQGFKITTEGTDWRGKFSYSFIAITPIWIIYGK